MSQIVKKGLETCADEHSGCIGCPYWHCKSAKCLDNLMTDALAYIETLEERLEKAGCAPSVGKAASSHSQGSLETEEQR